MSSPHTLHALNQPLRVAFSLLGLPHGSVNLLREDVGNSLYFRHIARCEGCGYEKERLAMTLHEGYNLGGDGEIAGYTDNGLNLC